MCYFSIFKIKLGWIEMQLVFLFFKVKDLL